MNKDDLKKALEIQSKIIERLHYSLVIFESVLTGIKRKELQSQFDQINVLRGQLKELIHPYWY